MPQAVDEKRNWIAWAFFAEMADALSLTLSYMFSKTVTEQYPDKETWSAYPRHRGHHFLKRDEEGEIKCVACELCAKICPCYCITVVPYEDEKGARRPLKFDIDMARCLFCGLCEDACPEDAIALGQLYEYSSFESEDLVVGRDDLLAMPGKTESGGVVVRSRLNTDEGVRVEASDTEGYDWWRSIRRT